MSRSKKLGHCVCNPLKPCPCDLFLKFNICECAGEKMPVTSGAVALTRHVRRAGCASKIGQADLLRILGNLPPVVDPNVIVGAAAGDDAGIYRIDDTRALVQTVDVFTPCVDDPHLFGQIAAANSVSDVYAMGGKPLTALSIVGFPIDELDGAILEAMLRGGMDKLEEAGCALVGGHSINDEEIKLGFAVTGMIDATAAVARDAAQPGDVLVLTKPLGTGMVSFAAQLGLVSEACLAEVGQWMAMLNKDAAELMVAHGAHACTDVTGYALAGHLVEMVRRSGVNAEIDLSAVPVFGMVRECIRNSVFGGAVERNQAYAMNWIRVADGADMTNVPILYDPQTSGGLLIALPEERGRAFVDAMHARRHTATSVIGRIIEKPRGQQDGLVLVTNTELSRFVGLHEPMDMSTKKVVAPLQNDITTQPELGCCCDMPPADADDDENTQPKRVEDHSVENLALFKDFMKEVNKPGLIDAQNKKLMAIALSISQRCEPCLKIHLQTALQMGVSKEAIDEAAGLAIAFGGCSAMMFYQEVRAKVKA